MTALTEAHERTRSFPSPPAFHCVSEGQRTFDQSASELSRASPNICPADTQEVCYTPNPIEVDSNQSTDAATLQIIDVTEDEAKLESLDEWRSSRIPSTMSLYLQTKKWFHISNNSQKQHVWNTSGQQHQWITNTLSTGFKVMIQRTDLRNILNRLGEKIDHNSCPTSNQINICRGYTGNIHNILTEYHQETQFLF
ncbi:hypothetical protein F2P81_023399 [Scophthalmus maximus]|uniref:Uncharacterized protein n=1 Tax=Scophthalmus maximus TaxID=52904 RepID=A0A6A4RW37_SCOMX|nr:hypothetical protein F2P81_023399 [Scophthalmus maximus]